MNTQPSPPVGTIKSVLQKLVLSSNPIIQPLTAMGDCSVTIIGLNKGSVLPDHTTNVITRLTVLSGCVIYRDPDNIIPLFDLDEHEIPVGVIHSLKATRKSICMLFKGS